MSSVFSWPEYILSREIRNIEKIRINTFDNNNPPVKNQPVKFAQRNYPHLKNLNFVNSGTGSGEIDLLGIRICEGELWYGGWTKRDLHSFWLCLIGPVANVDDIRINHQNQSSVTTTPVSLTLEESYFDHFDGVVKKGSNFDWSSRGLNLDGS